MCMYTSDVMFMGSHALCGMQKFMKYVVLVFVPLYPYARRFVFADFHLTCQMVLCRMQGICCNIPSLKQYLPNQNNTTEPQSNNLCVP